MTSPAPAAFLCLPGADPARLAADLAACLPDWAGTVTPLPPEALPGEAERVVVLHPDWPDRLAAAMAAGQAPCAALADWTAETEALLARHRANRRRMLLVPPRLLQDGDAAGLQDLARWAGLDPAQVRAPAGAAAPDPVLVVLARQAFAEMPAAAAPALALAAASLPVPDRPAAAGCTPDAAFARLQGLAQTEGAHAAIAGDKARLAQALGQQQDSLVQLAAELEAAQAQAAAVPALQAERDGLRAERDSLQAERDGMQARLDLMAEHIALCQEELVRLAAAEQAALAGRATLEHELVTLRKAAEAERATLERRLLRQDRTQERQSDCRQALALAQATIQRMTAEIRLLVEQMARGTPA